MIILEWCLLGNGDKIGLFLFNKTSHNLQWWMSLLGIGLPLVWSILKAFLQFYPPRGYQLYLSDLEHTESKFLCLLKLDY